MAGQPGRSGGRREGQRGKQYRNRSDLRGPKQPIQTADSKTYGDATSQQAAQKIIPLSRPAAPASGGPSPAPASGAPTMAGGGGPPVIPSLTAPTTRPNEPITAGLKTGPGPGPEAIRQPQDPTLAMLQGAYSKFPNADLLALIQEAQTR